MRWYQPGININITSHSILSAPGTGHCTAAGTADCRIKYIENIGCDAVRGRGSQVIQMIFGSGSEFHIPGGGNGKTKHFITSDLGPGIKMIIYFILVQAVTTVE